MEHPKKRFYIIFKHVPIKNFKHEDLFIEMKRKQKHSNIKKMCENKRRSRADINQY